MNTKLLSVNLIFCLFFPFLVFANDLKNSPPGDCPLDFFYYGYDLVKGNPAGESSDPGWRFNAIMDTSRLDDPCVSCSSNEVCEKEYDAHKMSTELDYYYSLEEKVNVDGSSEDFFSETKFTGSAEYQYQQSDIFGLTLRSVQAEASCQLFSGSRNLSCYDVTFSVGFANDVATFPLSTEDPNWYGVVNNFIQKYGTHIISNHTNLGAKWAYESLFTNASYEAMRFASINVDAAAEVSAEFFRTKGASAAYETSEETQIRVMFDDLSYKQRAISVGALPPEDISFGEWANNIDNPVPIGDKLTPTTLAPISQLFTRNFFPDDENIDAKHAVLEAGYLEYCAQTPTCKPPQPPKIVQVMESVEGKYETQNTLEAPCPQNYQLIGGGCQSERVQEPDSWFFSSMKILGNYNSYHCIANMDFHDTIRSPYQGLTATAICLHDDYIQDVKVEPCDGVSTKYGSECQAICPVGYLVTGGGCESNSLGEDRPWKVTQSEPDYENNGWRCKVAEDAESFTFDKIALGYAVCTLYAEDKLVDQTVVNESSGTAEKFTNGIEVQCDPGYSVLSGGCSVTEHSKPTDEWKIIESQPAMEYPQAWSCRAQEDRASETFNQDVTTHALCALLK